METMDDARPNLTTFFCCERGCHFDPTNDEAEAVDHGQETGHRIGAAPGSVQDVAGRMRAEIHEDRVSGVVARLPKPTEGYVVFEAPVGMKLVDVIEATQEVDIVRQFDRWVKMPRGYATVGFLRQLFAVTG